MPDTLAECWSKREAAEARVVELERYLKAGREEWLLTSKALEQYQNAYHCTDDSGADYIDKFAADSALLELAEMVEERIDMSVCNKRCPACVEFTTVFQMPKMEYMGCLRKQSDSNTLNNRHDAPLGQPCPFYAACEYEEAGDE